MHNIPIEMRDLARDAPLAVSADDATRDIGTTFALAYALAALALRTTLRSLSGLRPGSESSVSKFASAVLVQRVAERTMRWLGPACAMADGVAEERLRRYMSVPTQLIGGGTAEVQLNVIAERILGLPRT
jgi:alkylation response protein AidB-like acyl-CoA dehydrogenase